MTAGSVSMSSVSPAMDNRGAAPPDITKSGLEQMRERLTKSGGTTASGLDTLIARFDEAAGSSGKMTAQQFRAFAAENGVNLPDPGRGKPLGGAPPAGGSRPARPAAGGGPERAPAGAGKSAASAASTSSDVTSLSDADLQAMAAKGDSKAIAELEKREAAKAQLQGNYAATFSGPRVGQQPVGNAIDVYA